MTTRTTTDETAAIAGLAAAGQRVVERRKLAVGRAILAAGCPITGTAVMGATRASGVPVASPFYPNTLRQFGFLARVPGVPVRWTLTAAGVAFVEERKEVVL